MGSKADQKPKLSSAKPGERPVSPAPPPAPGAGIEVGRVHIVMADVEIEGDAVVLRQGIKKLLKLLGADSE